MVPVLQAHPVDVPVIVGHAATGEHAGKSVQNDSLLLFNCFSGMEHLKGLFINYVAPLGGVVVHCILLELLSLRA